MDNKINLNELLTIKRMGFELYGNKYGFTTEEVVNKYYTCVAYRQLDATINVLQSKTTTRTIATEDLLQKILQVESELDIPIKYLDGSEMVIDLNAQFPASRCGYNYISTIVTVKNIAGRWHLISIERGGCREHQVMLKLSQSAKDAILRRYEVWY